MNNADYGLSLQKLICDEYSIDVNDWASAQFAANYNEEYRTELVEVIPKIFSKLEAEPTHLLTYTQEMTKGKHFTAQFYAS